jgi:zinc transporter ZupT
MDAALGGAAGVMFAASFTSLVIPGIEAEPNGGIVPVVVGLVLGGAVLDRADAWVPHVHVLITGRVREDGASGASAPSGGPDETRVASVLIHRRDALVDLCGGEPPVEDNVCGDEDVPRPDVDRRDVLVLDDLQSDEIPVCLEGVIERFHEVDFIYFYSKHAGE